MKLLPSDTKFFDFFKQQVTFICQAADLLVEGAAAGNSHLASAAHQIRALEARADTVIRKTFIRCRRIWTTLLTGSKIPSIACSTTRSSLFPRRWWNCAGW